MKNKVWTHLLFIIVTITLSLLSAACSGAENPPANTMESDYPQSISIPAEPNTDFQSSSQPEPNLWEHPISIREGMPVFTLQLRGEQDIFTQLSVINTSTGAIAYQMELDESNWIHKDRFVVGTIDMDFDGYPDIDIETGFGGNWKKYHIYLMWDPGAANFVGDIYGLAGLGLPSFDGEKKIVSSMARASASDHWYYKHRYIDGQLVTIEEEALNGVRDLYNDNLAKEQIKTLEPLYDEERTDFIQSVRKQLDEETMKTVVTEVKFLLLDISEVKILAEYAPDSTIGLLLVQYETSADIN
ncbi:hypothetical protein U6B65_12755 [Oscillospiraceae bacterium MB08-C2-2]|nr:hypothetical protein U6B65_12755 [Oscillospiraceae bacterium MB08-C2-2]